MDNRSDVREFLMTRRARITPERAGLPAFGGTRRVAGLRREELAMLAGMSVDYYVRLERGNLAGVSEGVLQSLATALQLDEIERAHLFDLARTANSSGIRPRQPAPGRVRPNVQRLLDSMTGPAYLRNNRFDILAANALGRAVWSPVFDSPAQPTNTARFTFLDPGAADFWDVLDRTASDSVAALRAEAGHRPYDKRLTDLIGELSTRSEDFRVRWAAHDVYAHSAGKKILHHPVVGRLELTYEAMTLAADEGLVMMAYGVEPGSPSEDALRLLASWIDTSDATSLGSSDGRDELTPPV